MAFDVNNFVIDRVVRGMALAQGDDTKNNLWQEGDVLFAINQITNPSLSVTSESTDAVDALGTPIATFYRSKAAEFSAENALFDMNLMATQSGTVKKVSSASVSVATPCFEEIDIPSSSPITLSHTPKDSSAVKVYLLNGDGTLGDKIAVASTATARTAVAISGSSLSFVPDTSSGSTPNGFKVGEQLFVMYEYDANGTTGNQAIEVTNTATNFPVGCKFIMEVLGADVCDQTNQRAA